MKFYLNWSSDFFEKFMFKYFYGTPIWATLVKSLSHKVKHIKWKQCLWFQQFSKNQLFKMFPI